MGEDGVVALSHEQVAFYSDAPLSAQETTRHAGTKVSAQIAVGQEVQPGHAVRTFIKTERDGGENSESSTHISMRVGGGWVSVPRSPRTGTVSRSLSPRSRPSRCESPAQSTQRTSQVSRPGTAAATDKRPLNSQWYLQTIGLPLVGPSSGREQKKTSLRWDKLRAAHTPTSHSNKGKVHFQEICEEMKGWSLHL